MVTRYNPQGKIILNTVPFDPAHFGGNGRALFGQDPSLFADAVDIFETMGYHQIWACRTNGSAKRAITLSES